MMQHLTAQSLRDFIVEQCLAIEKVSDYTAEKTKGNGGRGLALEDMQTKEFKTLRKNNNRAIVDLERLFKKRRKNVFLEEAIEPILNFDGYDMDIVYHVAQEAYYARVLTEQATKALRKIAESRHDYSYDAKMILGAEQTIFE